MLQGSATLGAWVPLGYARVSTADPVSLYGGICALVAVLDDHGGRVPSGPSSRWKGMEHDRAASDEVILSGYRFGAVIPPSLVRQRPDLELLARSRF